jgi:Phage terminase-like protein, large subunit
MLAEYQAAAKDLGIDLMPWQTNAARYIMALGKADKWRYRRIAVVVARQNGKTTIIQPRVLVGLSLGRQQLHIAQDRLRPRRTTFEPLADFLSESENREKYKVKSIRLSNGQEQITCKNGGSYTILAPTSGGARGGSYDDVYVDEAQEFEDFAVEAIIRPTTTARPNAQIVYFASAGSETSVVLNAIRLNRDNDERLAYLEWSASPERPIDDRDGWAEANPALGKTINFETLEDDIGSMEPYQFETEHLCRWVITMQPKLVNDAKWHACHSTLPAPNRPSLGISMDPSGTRASGVVAWPLTDGTIGVKVISDTHGSPIDTEVLGKLLKEFALRSGVRATGFDPWTDADLSRYVRGARIVNGREYANASEHFARLVEAGRIRWDEADEITNDLAWTARKPHETGAWMAVKAKEDRPITAVLAAIRAVWLASGPRPEVPKVL